MVSGGGFHLASRKSARLWHAEMLAELSVDELSVLLAADTKTENIKTNILCNCPAVKKTTINVQLVLFLMLFAWILST